jgi:hypothetical protein
VRFEQETLCGLYSSADGVIYAVGDEIYDNAKGFGRLVKVDWWDGWLMEFENRTRPFRVLDEYRIVAMILAARAMRGRSRWLDSSVGVGDQDRGAAGGTRRALPPPTSRSVCLLVRLDDRDRDTAAVGDLAPVLTRPLADRLTVLTARPRGLALTTRTARSAATCLTSGVDEGSQGLTEPGGVLL